MQRFAANLAFLFCEVPLLQRFAAARRAGFAAVEIAWAESVTAHDIAAAASDAGVEIVLCNAPVGDALSGGPGLSGVPGRQAQFREAIQWAADFAGTIGCRSVNVGASRMDSEAGRDACLATLVENLGVAGDLLKAQGIRALVEPLNSVDFPTILLSNADDTVSVIRACNHPNVFLQFDAYHMYQMHADALSVLAAHIDDIAHIQFADVPGRGAPGTGAIDFDAFFSSLQSLGYPGWMAAEYRPAPDQTEATLGWLGRFAEQVQHA